MKEWLINWGDGNTTDLPVSNPPPDTLGPSTDTQTFTHQYAHGHVSYVINAQALTDDDLTAGTTGVQVIAADPNFNPYADPGGPYEGGTYALNITPARDGGANDPVTYTIDWGDGTSPTTCQGSADGTSVPVQDHQYNEEGLRLVTVTPSYGSIQYTYVGTADASPTIAIPPEQAVAAGQSLSVSSSFTGGAAVFAEEGFENFESYIMYRPPGSLSQWVPLQVADWGFEVSATSDGVQFTMSLELLPLSWTTQFSVCTAEPQWTVVLPSGPRWMKAK